MSPSRNPVALGLGCDRGTPMDTIARAIDEALAQAGAGLTDVRAVASIDLKADEAGLLALATRHGWEIVFHPAAALAAVAVPNPSETVRRYTGTPSVSEAAALLAAGTDLTHLIVEKHKLRGPDGRNATVSVARLSTRQPNTVRAEPVEAPPPSCDKPVLSEAEGLRANESR
ncbi:cobalamin biosynthesis protein [Aromatoleum evansii]|uniref:Cobalamin biosynthesis protein n=1 Tax=Aromatoleum evansii TaxID=59406 RepID=A0ABZ1AJF4_AROEV|nr:cobalamin biosynthesis protein [Aromatoleum evansii]